METTFDGFYPTHPGEVLKDELEERGISQRKFAESIGMGYSVLNEILNDKRPITTTSALMFEAALDIPADSLLKLQMKYNMHTARKGMGPRFWQIHRFYFRNRHFGKTSST